MPYFSNVAQRLLILSLVLAATALLSQPAHAACSGIRPNLTAPTWADVAACHTVASNGDTITVAAGNYTVTTFTTITKYVKIVAGGTVTLTDNSCNGICQGASESMLSITESAAGSTRFQGFTINQGTAQHKSPAAFIRLGRLTTPVDTGKPIIIIGNTYHSFSTGDFIVAATTRGVISGHTMTATVSGPGCLNNAGFVRHKMTSPGSPDWATPPAYGMADTNGDQNLYIETNTAIDVVENFLDTDDYARTVVRYNTLTNSSTGSHGNDTSGTGARYMDIYNNTFIRDTSLKPNCDGGTLPTNINGLIVLRGGTALIHNNVIPDLNDGAWGNKYEVTFFAENVRRNSGPYPCWSTLTQPGAGHPIPHQTGWGYSTGGTQPGTTRVFQDLEPIYVWGNTGAGNYNAPAISDYPLGIAQSCPGNDTTLPKARDYIVENREYYLNRVKPGYTPYTYPHPLVNDGTKAVTPVANQPPVVDAGPDRVIQLPTSTLNLSAAVNDDGLPKNSLTLLWTMVAGNGVNLEKATSGTTAVTFSGPGTYILRLTANDGELSRSDDVVINVLPAAVTTSSPPPPHTSDHALIVGPRVSEVLQGRLTPIIASTTIKNVAKLELRIDGQVKATEAANSIRYVWDPRQIGTHTIEIFALNSTSILARWVQTVLVK